MFGRSDHKQDFAGVTGLTVNWMTYLGSVAFGFYPLYVSAIAAFVITFGQSRMQRNDTLRFFYQKYSKSTVLTPKGMTYPAINTAIVVLFALAQVVDSFI